MSENGNSYVDEISVKFVEGGELFLEEDGRLYAEHLNLDRFNELVSSLGDAELFRSFSGENEIYRELVDNARRRLDRFVPSLDLFVRIRLNSPVDNVEELLYELKQDEAIETVQLAALPGPPPSPNFTNQQGYMNASVAGGVNAAVAWAVPGGDGSEVRVVDCEYGFNPNHEDLPDVAVVYNGDGVLSVRADHGTAVLAILGGRNDVSGVTGICHGASLQFASESGGHRLDCLDALLIRLHNQQLTAGDVILLEMQTENDFLPAEYNNDFRAAVLTLVGNDICVVAAAGNGGKRLDNIPVWDSQNSHDDSGAIMVGAGASVNTSKPHSHLGVSNFGTRVNCQAWGLDVVTAGYNGDLHDNGLNERYTQSFANTSSASAIVAGVVACLQGAHKAHFDTHILPLDIRDALANPDFGIPQANSFFDPAANFPIGPLPDLERLLIHFGLL